MPIETCSLCGEGGAVTSLFFRCCRECFATKVLPGLHRAEEEAKSLRERFAAAQAAPLKEGE